MGNEVNLSLLKPLTRVKKWKESDTGVTQTQQVELLSMYVGQDPASELAALLAALAQF